MAAGPSLYHYQEFDAARLRPIIEQNTIYFSSPMNFNDPWDCRPCFDASILENRAARERHIAYFVAQDRKCYPKTEADHARVEHRLRNEKGCLETLVKKMSGIEADISERFRVYCLCARPDCPLMWAHYSGKHSGVCLEYDANEPTTIAAALPVDYRDQYPSLDLTDQTPAVLLALTTKSAVWAYEAEYRLIAQERAAAASRGVTLLTDNNLLTLPVGALRAVIVGCAMPEAARDVVRSMVARTSGNVAFHEAVRTPNRYELTVS